MTVCVGEKKQHVPLMEAPLDVLVIIDHGVAWLEVQNLQADVAAEVLEETYLSLLATEPGATYLSFDPLELIAETQASSSIKSSSSRKSSSSTKSSSTSTSSPDTLTTPAFTSTSPTSTSTALSPTETTLNPPSVPQSSDSNNSVSGGAIAGAVAGGLVGIVLIVLGIFFLRKKKQEPRSIDLGMWEERRSIDVGIWEQSKSATEVYQQTKEGSELSGTSLAELQGRSAYQELSAGR
ncbi:hypothetical protein FQN51_006592 [Onygenales sp. PD_10]|nr:hypothetical protein FQN51_006592 [Onygenales sp. PD_10]